MASAPDLLACVASAREIVCCQRGMTWKMSSLDKKWPETGEHNTKRTHGTTFMHAQRINLHHPPLNQAGMLAIYTATTRSRPCRQGTWAPL